MRSGEKTQLLVRYLTGALPAEESRKLEEEYLRNEALHEELLAVETELLDACARGELPANEAQAVASHLAPEDLKRRLLFSHALRQRIDSSRSPIAIDPSSSRSRRLFSTPLPLFARLHGWRIAVPAAAAFLVASVSLIWLARRPEPIGPTAGASQPPSVPAVPQSIPALSLLLLPEQRGAAEANSLKLPAAGGKLRLELIVRNTAPYDRYAVTLKALGNPWSRTFRNLTVQTAASGESVLVVEVSTAGLPSDDYTASVSGIRQGREEEFAGYGFRLIQP